MAKGKKGGGRKVSITPRQRAARRKNMAIARAARSRYSKAGGVLKSVGRKATSIGGKNFLEAASMGKSKRGGRLFSTMGHTRRITSGLKKAGVSFKRKGQIIRIQ